MVKIVDKNVFMTFSDNLLLFVGLIRPFYSVVFILYGLCDKSFLLKYGSWKLQPES